MFTIVICAQNLTRWCITADIVGTAQGLTALASVRIRGTLTLALAAVLLAVLPPRPKSGNNETPIPSWRSCAEQDESLQSRHCHKDTQVPDRVLC